MGNRAGDETAAANGALRKIGQPPIADIVTSTELAARVCRASFASTRDAILREKDWNFATAWATPAKVIDKVGSGPFPNLFPLPSDNLKIRGVTDLARYKADSIQMDYFNSGRWSEAWSIPWSFEAQGDVVYLATPATTPLVCYTRRIELVAMWDAAMLAAFELRLAAEIAPTIGRDVTEATRLEARSDVRVRTASELDTKEHMPEQVSRETSWTVSRR